MKTTRIVCFLLIGTLAVGGIAQAQGMFGGPQPKDSSEHLSKIFGKDAAFTATMQVTVKNKQGREMHSMEMAYAVLGGKVRTEIDVTKMRHADMPPEAMMHVKQMGMDRTVSIFRPDKNLTYLVYPGLKAYAAITSDDTAGVPGDDPEEKPAKIERTELGKETIDGHPCVKTKVTVTEARGQKQEWIVWEATDLDNFPIQTQMTEGGDTTTMRFRDINKSKPAASLFEPPADYKKYANIQQLMMGTMHRMMPPTPMPGMGLGDED